LLKASSTVKDVTMEWVPGKHSGKTGERLVAAQLWMNKRLWERELV
jgi:hypothetical protein